MSKILCAAGFLGFSAIALGAYGDHGLRVNIDEAAMRSFETAIRYQLFHAIALLGIGLFLSADNAPSLALHKWITRAALVLLAGTLIFCGSIYASIIFDIKGITKATPFGGITLMAGWLTIMWAGCMKKGAQ